jgi:hypothetical protein
MIGIGIIVNTYLLGLSSSSSSTSSSSESKRLSIETIRCLDFLFQGDPVLERAFEHVDREEVARFTTPVVGRVLYAVLSSSILRSSRARSSHSHHVTIASLCSSTTPVTSIRAHAHIVTISKNVLHPGSCTCFGFSNASLMRRADLDQDQVSLELAAAIERVPNINESHVVVSTTNTMEATSSDINTSSIGIQSKNQPRYGYCKHILAAIIAEAVGRFTSRALTTDEVKQIF